MRGESNIRTSFISRDLVQKDETLALFLAIFYLSLLLTVPNFRSIDEVALYTTATNLSNHGQLQLPQLGFALWGQRSGEAVVLLSDSNEIFTKKSPAVILALWPLLKIGAAWPAASQTKIALLYGPIILATTAVLLVKIALKLRFRRRTGWSVALLFATGSMALPYSQTIFGELLAMLALTLVAWTFAVSPANSPKTYFLAGVGCAVAIGCNIGYGIAVPVVLLAEAYRIRGSRPTLTSYLLFALPLAFAGGSLALYNLVRFGSILESGYQLAADQEGFTNPLGWGLMGLWLSPARGFLWYNPLTFLGLWGWPALYRSPSTRPLSWFIGGLTVAISLVFATWWQWWGGYGWGPRFLLPLVPLFSILALPVIEKTVFSPGRNPARMWRAGLIGGIVLAGILVQTAGVAVNYNDIELLFAERFPGPGAEVRPLLYHHDPQIVFAWDKSPILWQWRYLRDGRTQPLASSGRPKDKLIPLIQLLGEAWQPGDVVLHLGSLDGQAAYEPADVYPVYGLPINIDPADPIAQKLFLKGVSDRKRVWIISQLPLGTDLNWYEQTLWADGWAGLKTAQLRKWRAVLMVRPFLDGTPSWNASGAQFGPLTLDRYRLICQANQLQIAFQWRLREPTSSDLTQFVHLMQEGELDQQQDRTPWNGFQPTSRWIVEEPLIDRFAFDLEEGRSCADYQVGVGWYDWRDPTPLAAVLNDQPLPNGRLLIEVKKP